MTFETNAGTPAEHAQPVGGTPASGSSPSPTPVQIRLQILTTEHWSLLASRGLAWNEAFARAGMYLSTLSATLVALSLIGGIDHFGDAFFTFAFVILPVIFFVGIGAWLRMAASNYHDARTVAGMNRIRGAYLEIAPDLEPYFVMGVHDDPIGIGITMALPPGLPAMVHLISSTPFLVTTLNALVAGAIAALVLVRFTTAPGLAVVGLSIAFGVLTFLAEMAIARANISRGQRATRPMFPTPGDVPADDVPRRLL